jgi:hypothetical protein
LAYLCEYQGFAHKSPESPIAAYEPVNIADGHVLIQTHLFAQQFHLLGRRELSEDVTGDISWRNFRNEKNSDGYQEHRQEHETNATQDVPGHGTPFMGEIPGMGNRMLRGRRNVCAKAPRQSIIGSHASLPGMGADFVSLAEALTRAPSPAAFAAEARAQR